MEFIALLIALSFERWTAFGHLMRRFKFFEGYISLMNKLLGRFSFFQGYVGVVCILFPIALLVFVIQMLLLQVFYGIFGVVFFVFVLIYTLGSFNLVAHTETVDVSELGLRKQHIAEIFMQGNRNFFSVVFWYAALGSIGAVVYRLNSLLIHHDEMGKTEKAARKVEQVLEWIPVRLMALGSALVSHFNAVIGCFLKHVLTGLSGNEVILAECGYAAFGEDEIDEDKEIQDVQKKVVLVIERVLIIWLVVIALAILV